MDTSEHTELGNALRFTDWRVLAENPYLRFDEKGTLILTMQGLDEKGIPQELALKISAGAIIGMSGDYFGGKEVDLELPTICEFNKKQKNYNPDQDYDYNAVNLGNYLIKEPITETEEQKLIRSYKRLANPEVTQDEIDTIYAINDANYIPFSSTLNSYAQELMFALRVKNYSEILNRNMSHFTPWSVRAYAIGHHVALKYARLYYEFTQLIAEPDYQSDNEEFNTVIKILKMTPAGINNKLLQDLAYRYQALSLEMELFCFHYYTDHFAAGHGALIGDLRVLLPQSYGVLGGILVNNLHDELNRVTVYTRRPYDPTPDKTAAPIEAGGDGDFNSPKNYFNKLACMDGMDASLEDLHQVFKGAKIPPQEQYGGLEHMPDVDNKYRQPQPLLLLGKDNKIYYRTDLKVIKTLAPSQLKNTYHSPLVNGYTELTSTWSAFILVFKLRVLSFIYSGTLQELTPSELLAIEEEEQALNPGRRPIPRPPVTVEPLAVPTWQTPAKNGVIMAGLQRNGLMPSSDQTKHEETVEQGLEASTISI